MNNSKNIITVNDLSKVYKVYTKEPGLKGAVKSLFHSEFIEKTAVDSISFTMGEGEALACIGENGAGKSTLIKMLVGILMPNNGTLKVNGFIPQEHKENYLRSIGVIFGQKTNLWWDIPVIESYNAIQTLYKIPKVQYNETFKQVKELLDLDPILNTPARKLSLGQRMKADIGMVFLHRPQILFLDEPTIGLDINMKYTIRKFIREMNREQGTSVLLTSHDLDDIEQICDNALVLSKGRLVYHGSLEELKQSYITHKIAKVTGKQKKDVTTELEGVEVTANGHITSIKYDFKQIPSSQLLEALNRCFDIEDISIFDMGIEQVVSRIFNGERKGRVEG
jgi:ABC-2 type transport system ATP-binding protein